MGLRLEKESKVTYDVAAAEQEATGYHELVFAAREFKFVKFPGSEPLTKGLTSRTWEAPLPIILMGMIARTKGIFVDVGGNSGIYTILAGVTRADVNIHTFEPFPEAADILRRNVALNGIQERVTLHDVALSDRAGHAELYLPDPGHGRLETSASLEAEFKKQHAECRHIETRTLDSYSFDQPVSIVKIDVEGHEYAVIKGAQRMLIEDRPVIFAEMLSGAKKHFFGISKLMADQDYVSFRMWRNCLIETPIIIPDRQSSNYGFVPQEMLPTFRLVCATHNLEMLTQYK